ncbi:MAG: hypothetical protein CMJ54_02770 [Planctomycetaceae bacterium]|nr:hypothetical protein [Planctomycetaceae bacterium]
MAEGRGTDFDAVDAEASFEHVVVPGVHLGADVGTSGSKSASSLSIDERGTPGVFALRLERRGAIRVGGLVGFGGQDAEDPQRCDEQREHAARGSSITDGSVRMGERSRDGLETIVRGHDLPDVVSTGSELNEGHGHGGGSLRSGWHLKGGVPWCPELVRPLSG